MMWRRLLPALIAAILELPASGACAAGLPLLPVADVPLGGNTTRLDYTSVDADRHLLFIAHLGDSAVIVFDMQARRVVARIANVSKVHGVLALPQLGKVYASATGTNEVVAIDDRSWQVTARVPAGVYPDGMAYAPEVRKLYVSDEHGNTETVIDVDRDAPARRRSGQFAVRSRVETRFRQRTDCRRLGRDRSGDGQNRWPHAAASSERQSRPVDRLRTATGFRRVRRQCDIARS
jgi:hypothetical protein